MGYSNQLKGANINSIGFDVGSSMLHLFLTDKIHDLELRFNAFFYKCP